MTAIIAEIGLGHDGSLGSAMRLIDCAASCGADAVKFQCHDGDPVSEFRPGTSFPQDRCRQDYWLRTAFSREQWQTLVDHAHKADILFGVSCFSRLALDNMLAVKGVDFLKVGSGQTADTLLIREAAKTGLPLYLSTGMSDFAEVERAVEATAIERTGPLTLMQCVSKYPTAPEEWGIKEMRRLLDRFPGYHVGLSDHSGSILPGILAAWEGAAAVEVHLTFGSWCFGPDVPASLTPKQLTALCEARKHVAKARVGKPREAVAREMESMRKLFRPEGV